MFLNFTSAIIYVVSSMSNELTSLASENSQLVDLRLYRQVAIYVIYA